MSERKGMVAKVSGTVVIGKGIPDIEVGEVVEVGPERLIGEVIRVRENYFTCQVYEPTTGIKPGDPILGTGRKLVAELGPGLISNIIDGIGRPLEELLKKVGPFIKRGVKAFTLPRDKKWTFKPTVKKGEKVSGGDIIGTVQESPMVEHRIMVPHGVSGTVKEIYEGDFTVTDPVCYVESDGREVPLTMMQEWPVRMPRPFKTRLPLEEPLITGQRVFDVFFPVAKGGAACIPGGFGTGKTVMLHQLAKWSDAHVVVYIGCGERGNEMAEVLTDFPRLVDPRTNRPLMERTVLVANTSNMPVSAREASIYIGVTIAEYFRDMGYHVALMADSTSRWAEAIREVAGRIGEMPVERGYPAYLPDRIAEFYERAGRVVAIGRPERVGSVTIMGAVSPPGGDFNEPVTIHTLRFTGVFWALDTDLAYSRHFPAVHWLKSYSLYADSVLSYFVSKAAKEAEYVKELPRYREEALKLLSDASEIEAIARIIGEKALPDDQRLVLLMAELIKEGFLRQFAFDEVDCYCPIEKQAMILKTIMDFYHYASKLIQARVPIEKVSSLPVISKMMRMKYNPRGVEYIREVYDEMVSSLKKLAEEYEVQLD
ncbi:V-type ATP synthase subunit A [Candidatus Geothermarchaeota archaeon ex4572_27]|nr:MAG: V-type ATP synthase subunit A [Candidatus Geothermarchaeota archaeon ex4572_27]